MELLHVYVDLVAADIAAAERYPGVAAHLAACGPSSEGFRRSPRHTQHLHRGTAHLHSLRDKGTTRPSAARFYGDDAIDGFAGMVRFERDVLDAWFEEDEQVFVHPRNPYVRVDALRSTRRVRIELDGTVLAESASPVMVFETGLPTGFYLNRSEVNFDNLRPSDTVISCPYKGQSTSCWNVSVGDTTHPRPGLGLRLPYATPPHRRPGRLLQREGRHHL
jgi:uncharacterized protein (DUF427 family)